MAKQLYTRHVDDELDQFEHVHPSCMWGFLHAIEYHQWLFNLKRMLLKKINPQKRLKGNRSSKAKKLVNDPGEMQNLLIQESARKSGLNSKRSPKAQVKSLIAEEISKVGNDMKGGASKFSQPTLQRTHSIHHLEPPGHGFGEICTDWELPIHLFPSNKENSARKLENSPKMNVKDKKDAYRKKTKELSNKDASKDEVLEIFKVNKDLFLEIVQDKDGSLRKFSHTLPSSKSKARLTKSGSFPAAELSQKRSLEPLTLKQKQSEIRSDPKGVKLPPAHLIKKVEDEFKHSKHVRSKSLPIEYSSRGSKLAQALNFIIVNTSKSDKRYDKTGTSRDDEDHPFNSLEIEEYSFSNNACSCKRSSSLNESMDKYNWLFENNLGKALNLHPSRSLKLRNDEMGSCGIASTLFRRIHSLSNADIYSSLQNGVHGDANLESWPITTWEENSSCRKDGFLDELNPAIFFPIKEEKDGQANQMDNSAESRENNASRMEDLKGKDDALTVGENTLYAEQENNCFGIAPSELPQPCPAPAFETCFEKEMSGSFEYQASEGCDLFDEKVSSINCKKSFNMEPSSLFFRLPNLVDHMKDAELVEYYNEYNADIDYVKNILENSGFAKDASDKKWYSPNQPLDPLVFDETEVYWHEECSAEEYCFCYHHQLLFDLVNEKLLHIYERSFAYYPKALSSSCYFHPFPVGDHIVDEICTSVSTLMRLKTEQKQSLECLVALDIGKDDGWMNLQLESEYIGLEVEDIIFDELVAELVCS